MLKKISYDDDDDDDDDRTESVAEVELKSLTSEEWGKRF